MLLHNDGPTYLKLNQDLTMNKFRITSKQSDVGLLFRLHSASKKKRANISAPDLRFRTPQIIGRSSGKINNQTDLEEKGTS